MKQLFDHIKKSIYGPAYYRELVARPFSFSLKYYSAFALFLTLFLTIVSSIPLVPRVNQFVSDFPTKFFVYYPDPLEVKIEKGVVSSNVVEPYFLPVPEEFKDGSNSESGMNSLLVIDTKTPFSVAQFKEYNVAAWLGRDKIAVFDQNGSIRIKAFDTKTELVINENALRGFEQRLQPFYKFAAPLFVIVIFLGLLIVFGVNFLYLLLGAVLIFLLLRLLKQRFDYGASYRIGLHAITLPLFLSSLFSLFDLSFLDFPFLFTALMLAVVYVNFKDVATVS